MYYQDVIGFSASSAFRISSSSLRSGTLSATCRSSHAARCSPTGATMPMVSTESLAVTTLLTKRHANIGCERYPPIRALSNRDTQWGGRDNEHITAQMRRPSRQRTWSTTSQNSKTHKVEKSCPARANETAFMRRAHEPEIAPSPGAPRVRCGPTHAHKTRRSMREV